MRPPPPWNGYAARGQGLLLPVRCSAPSMDLRQPRSDTRVHARGCRRPEIQATVDVQRFDAILGKTVMIDALWTMRSAAGKPAPGVREMIGGNGYDALVSAHSRALAALSQQIAEAIRSGKTTGP
jgi:uncharacterized lipoprotein YmbA